jgi:hypothetical protein
MSWIGVSVGVAVASAAFTAMIADQLTEQRGTASASISSSQALGSSSAWGSSSSSAWA